LLLGYFLGGQVFGTMLRTNVAQQRRILTPSFQALSFQQAQLGVAKWAEWEI